MNALRPGQLKRELTEIGGMYLLVVAIFLMGALLWKISRHQQGQDSWKERDSFLSAPRYYGR